MQLAVRQANRERRAGRTLELLFENTSGSPAVAVDAVRRLGRQNIAAYAGEYHSVVADAIVEETGRLPFLCASATLDRITSRRLANVFRLSPPQSHGWEIYARYLRAADIRHVIAVVEHSVYWNAGASVIESSLLRSDVKFTRIDVNDGLTHIVERVRAAIDERERQIILFLLRYPDNLRALLQSIGIGKSLSSSVLLGDPPGRPAFRDWWDIAGPEGIAVPFLAYQHPRKLSDRGENVVALFEREYGREPTFVALEGYDSILALAAAIKEASSIDPHEVCRALRHIEIQGTRGRIRFSTEPNGVVHQQWKYPPVVVVAFQHAYQRFADCDILWEATADSWLETR